MLMASALWSPFILLTWFTLASCSLRPISVTLPKIVFFILPALFYSFHQFLPVLMFIAYSVVWNNGSKEAEIAILFVN